MPKPLSLADDYQYRNGTEQSFSGQRHTRISESSLVSDIPAIMGDKNKEPEVEIDISAGQKMLSAVSGSLLTSILVTPLDVVRVRLQSQPQSTSITSRTLPSARGFANLPQNLGVTACCREVFWMNNNSQVCMVADSAAIEASSAAVADCAVDETRRKTFNSTIDGLRKIARNEGIRSLWRGLSPTLVMAIPGNVIYFTGYDSLRYNAHSPIRNYISDAYVPLAAGSIARTAAATVVSPIEMFRTRMQATTGNTGRGVFVETLIGLRKLVHAEGYTSLWRGLTLTMWRDVPFSGIYWWGYETVRNAFTEMENPTSSPSPRPRSSSRSNENHTTTFLKSFVSGATSGAIAALVTTPFDVGKTRKQVFEHASQKNSSGLAKVSMAEQLSMPKFLYRIWLEEGVTGLFRGWTARCLKVAPACAIMISSYEIGKKMAKGMNEKKLASEIERRI